MLRVASVPADHPYVRHIMPAGGVAVQPEIYHEVGRWWPPQRLDATWLREHAHEHDLLHVHFGYESFDAAAIGESVAALRETRTPMVLTVHDLQNPHLPHDDLHLALTELLVEAADAVVTLTSGAAAEIEWRWGRSATVIPHPHIVELADIPHEPPVGGRIGVPLGDLRQRVALEPIADELRALARVAPLSIDVQTRAWNSSASTRELVSTLGADEIVVHPPLSDDELYAAVRRTRVQVLPYARGTHSGWLEMCLDLGVAVAAPTIGYLREQHPGHELVASYTPGEPGSLQTAVRRLLDVTPNNFNWAAVRRAQRRQIATAYLEVYRAAMRRTGAARSLKVAAR